MPSCEFWEISKNTFFTEHLRKTAFVYEGNKNKYGIQFRLLLLQKEPNSDFDFLKQ